MHALLVVAVLTYAPPSGHATKDLGRVADALARATRASGAEVLADPIDRAEKLRAEGWEEQAAFGFFKEGAQALAEARHALERVELARAQAAFARAGQIYHAHLDRPGAATLASDAALGEGVALFELGRPDEAAQAFRRARALEPTAELTQATVRPDIARAFAEAVKVSPPSEPIPIAAVKTSDEVAAELAALAARPSGAGVRALAHALDVPLAGALAVAVGIDAGVPTLVGQRFDAAGCASPALTVVARAGIDRAASELVARIARLPVACGAGAPSADGRLVVEAPPIESPRPAVTAPPPPKPRPLRFWERPWMWAGLLAVTSVAVGLAAGLAPSSPSYRATVSGSAFSH